MLIVFPATTQRTWPNVQSGAFGEARTPATRAVISSALVAIKITPRLYDMKCAASRDEKNCVGEVPGVKDAHRQWPATRGKRGRLALWAHSVGGDAG